MVKSLYCLVALIPIMKAWQLLPDDLTTTACDAMAQLSLQFSKWERDALPGLQSIPQHWLVGGIHDYTETTTMLTRR